MEHVVEDVLSKYFEGMGLILSDVVSDAIKGCLSVKNVKNVKNVKSDKK